MRATLVISMIILLVNLSCSKGDSTTTVEYRITPAGNYYGQITYNDGPYDVVSDATSWANNSKSFTISAKPFLAHFTTEFEYRPGTPEQFDLQILVNGQVKKSEHGHSTDGFSFSYTVEFLVE